MKPTVMFVKEINGFRCVGRRDEHGDLIAECSCGHSLWGHQDYWALRSWITQHCTRHILKAVSK